MVPIAEPTSDDYGCRPQMLQIIDENKQFSKYVPFYMDKWGLADAGFDYHLVAVFGSQSTGKSTLLNRLFQTEFDVMDQSKRQQTTKGLWLSKAKDCPILVMDVEGTDGRERGEDQEFERRSALFSLTVAEVIIVNIWENMVGLYNGANMGLLKTVFEANLQLFQHKDSPKTLLLFVIRDFIGTTTLESLRRVLLESLDKIWAELSKPPGFETSSVTDLFSFDFVALPHKVLQPEKFEEEALKVRDRFIADKQSEYLFAPEYHRKIPADGLYHYIESIWDKIIGNKDLDLPTQQQLLAQYRCDEILNGVFREFTRKLDHFEHTIASGKTVEDFKQLASLRETVMAEFREKASRYHADVFERKQEELLEKMNSNLHVIFVGQVRNLRKKAIADFKVIVQDILRGDSDHFASRLIESQQNAEKFFREHATNAVLERTNWQVTEDIRAFTEELFELASKIRSEEMDKLVKKLTKSAQSAITEGVMELFAETPKDMWPQALDLYHRTLGKYQKSFEQKVSGFAASQEESHQYLESLQSQIWECMRNKIKEELSDAMLQIRLKQRFEERFRYDDEGLPRVWSQDENFEPQFISAKDQAEELIVLFAKMPIPNDENDELILNDPDFDEDNSCIILLPASKQRDLKDRLKRDADMIFVEVKRGAVSSFSEIPKSMWLLLLVFGFNEIYAFFTFMISNPFMLILLTIIAATFIFLYQSGLLLPTVKVMLRSSGPMMQMAASSVGPVMDTVRLTVAETLKQASEKLENQEMKTAPSTPAKRPLATPVKRRGS